jgi:hypothetical protein
MINIRRYRLLSATLLFALASPGAWAAITFVSDGGYTASGTSTVTLTKPAGTALNDLEVMCVSVITNVSQGTITTPAGWTLVTSTGAGDDGGGTFVNTYAFVKVAGGSEPANYAISYNTGGTIAGMDGDIRDYSGTATSNPVNSFAAILTAANTTTGVVPALTETFISGEWYVACATSKDNAIPATSPSLSHIYSNSGFLQSYILGDLVPGSAPGAETFTYGANVPNRPALGLSIKPLIAGPALLKGQLPLTGAGK